MGGVEELQEMAGPADRLAAFDGLLDGSVEQGGGDALLKLGSDIADGLEQLVQVEVRGCRRENDGSVIEEEERFLDPLAEGVEVGTGLAAVRAGGTFGVCLLGGLEGGLEEVPFVDYENAGLVQFCDPVGDFLVLFENAGFGVEDEEGDIAAGDGGFSAFDAVEFDAVVYAAWFADAGGVDEQVGLPVAFGIDFERDIDRIASSAG